MMNNNTNVRTIHTGLYGTAAADIINSVHGQLSDGKWENSPGYDKYWTNFNVEVADDGEVIFKVNSNVSNWYCNKYVSNPFCGMPDDEFKVWIAKKIKAVINTEAKDDNWEKGWWNRRDTQHNTIYLNHNTDIIVAEVYCTYEALLGREIGITKYDSSTICSVFGTKRSEADIIKVKRAREHVAEVKAKYAKKRAELQNAKNEAVSKLEKELHDAIVKLNEEEKAELETA